MPQHVQRNQSGVCALRQQQRRHDADQCTEENQGSFTHHPRTFSPSLVAHHLLGSMGAPSLGRRRSNLAADFGESMRDFPKRARANLFEQLEPSTCHTSAGTPKFVRLINRTPCEFKFSHKRTSFCSFANSALSVW